MLDFTQVFRDDFEGSSLDRRIWKSAHSGEYWNGMFRWDPIQLEGGEPHRGGRGPVGAVELMPRRPAAVLVRIAPP